MHPYWGIAVVSVAILVAIVEFAVLPAWRWVRKRLRRRKK